LRYSWHNFRFAEEILNSKLALKKEIEDIINQLDVDPFGKGAASPHRVIKEAFLRRGWSDEERISCRTRMRFDLYKERIGIEIETSHIIHTYKDFLKFLVAFNDGKIDVGVEIVYDDSFIRRHNLRPARPRMSKVRNDLETLFRPIIPVPIFVIGLE